jgi:hypothetical protein
MGGISKYGGGAELGVRISEDNGEVVWTIRIYDPRLMQVVLYWVAEESTELINALDVDNLDATSRAALATMQSLNAKVAHAHANPVWSPVRVSGLIVEEDGQLLLESEVGRYKATGKHLAELEKRTGAVVIAEGYIKVEDEIEVTAFLEKRENTLELFVMSMCPFAKMAESSILDFLETYSGESRPALEIRYIFYKRKVNGKTVFTSMHGEKELVENVVQIIIRDSYPEIYYDYLAQRIEDGDSPWEKLVSEMGLSADDIESIQGKLEGQRETLIENEHDYVAGTYQIYDGSPAYVWECERVGDIRKIEEFENMDAPSRRCLDETTREE